MAPCECEKPGAVVFGLAMYRSCTRQSSSIAARPSGVRGVSLGPASPYLSSRKERMTLDSNTGAPSGRMSAGTYAKRAAKGGVRSGDGRRAAGRTRHLLERVDSRKVSLLQVGVGEHPALDRVAHPARALECHPKPHTCRIVAVAHVEEDWLLERLVQRRRGEGGAGASEGTVEVSHVRVVLCAGLTAGRVLPATTKEFSPRLEHLSTG